MQFSRDWLAQYVELEPLEVLAARLTAAGSSVEHVTESGDDAVLDVDVTGNRPDCMNHLGLAREIAVLRGVPLAPPRAEPPQTGPEATSLARVRVDEPGLCPRYSARVLEGVRVAPSPDWLRARLESIGARSINAVVDVTNFVLWELGQPLHAFDLDRLEAATIVVRRAAAREALVTLDGERRELVPDDLVIADAKRPVALAGIMGGQSSEVSPRTTRVLLESAHFDRAAVRRTAKRLGMHTDASHRFERGADPAVTVIALDRAAALLQEITGASVRAGVLDVLDPVCLERREIAFSPRRLDAFAGAAFAREDLLRWFEGLGLEVVDAAAEVWRVRVPSWRRFDLERAEDLYEEAMRVRGFDAIPAALPPILGSDGPETAVQRRRRLVRQHLVGQGFAETIQYAFVSLAEDAAYPVLRDGEGSPDEPIALANPLSERYAVLRRSMVPGLVDTARFNQRRGAGAVRLFEIGHLFLDCEEESLGIVLGGTAGTPWDGARAVDLFDLKGVVDTLLEAFAAELSIRRAALPGVLSGTGAELVASSGARVGWFGQLDCESPYPLYAAELFCRALGEGGEVPKARVPSRFPGVAADLTFTHSVAVPWADIAATITAAAPPELHEFALKDRYQGAGVPEGAVNTTVSFRYVAADRSLEQDEVNRRQAELARRLEQRFARPAKEGT
jgi:phenylalanyl-tRNA synthetase beta chain